MLTEKADKAAKKLRKAQEKEIRLDRARQEAEEESGLIEAAIHKNMLETKRTERVALAQKKIKKQKSFVKRVPYIGKSQD